MVFYFLLPVAMITQELGAGLTLPNMVFEGAQLDMTLTAVAAAVRDCRKALLIMVFWGPTQLEQFATNLQWKSDEYTK